MEPRKPYYGYVYGVSQKQTEVESSLSFVTLSEAKGLSRWASRCFAAAQHDKAEGNQVDTHYV